MICPVRPQASSEPNPLVNLLALTQRIPGKSAMQRGVTDGPSEVGTLQLLYEL